MNTMPDSNTAELNAHEHAMVALAEKQEERNQASEKHIIMMCDDHKYLMNELNYIEQYDLLDQILFIMQDTPQKDRESEISDEIANKIAVVANRLANREVV